MIIAIGGIPGSGKDVIGEDLKDAFMSRGYKASISKFAYVANNAYYHITGVNYLDLPREEKEKERDRFRAFAEGTKESLGQDIWAKALVRKREINRGGHMRHWIITDLRFHEEIKALRDLNEDVVLIRLRRKCDECGLYDNHEDSCSQNNLTYHETRLKNFIGWDVVVDNNATPTEVGERIIRYLDSKYKLKT